jgi:hypothetical protein
MSSHEIATIIPEALLPTQICGHKQLLLYASYASGFVFSHMELLNILYIIIKTFIFASKKASDAPGFLRTAFWIAETHASSEIADMQFIVPAGAKAF